MKIFGIIIITLLLLPHTVYSCDKEKKVVDCSENSWNPSNNNTSSKLNRFYELNSLITKKYKQGDFVSVKKLATEYLTLADNYKNNWNYGNAIHDANRVLGLISYQKGEYDEAVLYLSKAGKSSGSPQLDSFGPELDLANLLLKQGKAAEVKSYLVDIQTFWRMDNGIVNEWIEAIDRNEKPELTRFGDFRMSIYQKIFFWLAITWPIIASIAIFFIFKRKGLSPFKFIPAAIVTGYIILFIGNLILNAIIGGIMGSLPASLILPFIYTVTGIVLFGVPLLAIYLLTNVRKLRTSKRVKLD